MSLEFWTKLRDYCERKMGEKYAHTRKCPYCFRWTHAVGGADTIDKGKMHQLMMCRQCGNESCWRIIGPAVMHIPTWQFRRIPDDLL